MNKRELLEAAARAAGYNVTGSYGDGGAHGFWLTLEPRPFAENTGWNPLTDDGDALRLAVKLKLKVYQGEFVAVVNFRMSHNYVAEEYERNGMDANAATKLAIVRAAAAIDAQRREK